MSESAPARYSAVCSNAPPGSTGGNFWNAVPMSRSSLSSAGISVTSLHGITALERFASEIDRLTEQAGK